MKTLIQNPDQVKDIEAEQVQLRKPYLSPSLVVLSAQRTDGKAFTTAFEAGTVGPS